MAGYYLVRPTSIEAFTSVFEKDNVVGVGWSAVDFASCLNGAEVHNRVYEVYYKGEPYWPPTVSKWCNQAERFKDIKSGSKIIVPLPYAIALAEAKGNQKYDPALGKKFDLANLHGVEYKRDASRNIVRISRTQLSNGLQSRIRMMGSTCLDLDEFAVEIDSLFQYGEDAYTTAFSKEILAESEKVRTRLLKNIQNGKTILKAGGQGFERLIFAILQTVGYEAKIPSKADLSSGSDVDIIASKEDALLGEIKILVQAKHHTGTTGSAGILQLVNALNDPKYKDQDYRGIFITSAEHIDSKAQDLAAQNNISILKGEDVVELILSHLENLDQSVQDTLGIYMTPAIFSYPE